MISLRESQNFKSRHDNTLSALWGLDMSGTALLHDIVVIIIGALNGEPSLGTSNSSK